MGVVRYLHLLGATVWIGGLIVMGTTVSAVRSVSDDRRVLRAIARRFGVVSWTAMGLLVVTGAILSADHGWDSVLITKISLVVLSVLLAAWHSLGGATQSPQSRGLIQGLILILALVILGLAVAL
ncbi:MAG: hypothetical protein WBZ40_01390 [Acidimicrobiia bacterium]